MICKKKILPENVAACKHKHQTFSRTNTKFYKRELHFVYLARFELGGKKNYKMSLVEEPPQEFNEEYNEERTYHDREDEVNDKEAKDDEKKNRDSRSVEWKANKPRVRFHPESEEEQDSESRPPSSSTKNNNTIQQEETPLSNNEHTETNQKITMAMQSVMKKLGKELIRDRMRRKIDNDDPLDIESVKLAIEFFKREELGM